MTIVRINIPSMIKVTEVRMGKTGPVWISTAAVECLRPDGEGGSTLTMRSGAINAVTEAPEDIAGCFGWLPPEDVQEPEA